MRSFIGIEIQKLKSEFTVTTDFLAAEQKDLREEIQARREMIETLQTENSRLQKDVKSLEERLIAAEKLSRSKNIEIQAVPERKNEDLLRMFKKLCEAINLPLVDAEVHACRRVAKMDPKSDRPRNILVSLASPIIRDKILSAAARFNKASKNDPLSTKHLGMPDTHQRIYVAEHLSPDCKQLYAAARRTARESGIAYVWVKHGRVYTRKDEKSGAVLIKNMDTLKTL
ncbi:hypothetical protein ACJJTC_005800 [Scirpophaga incertulas]